MGASGTQVITIPSIAELKEKNIQDDFEEAVEMWMEGSVQGQDLKEGEEYEVYFGDYEIAFTLVKNGDKFVVNAVKVEQDLDETLKINETEILNEEESSFNVEIPDWLTSKLEQVHTKPGQGSIFAKPIKSVMDLVKSHLTKMNPKEVDKIANSTLGTVSFNVSGIGYDLVLPMEKAKTLKDAQQVEVEKVEDSNKINVPAIKTSEDVKNFSTGLLTIIVRPKKDDSGNVLKGQYIVLSAFPGNPEIPKTSKWNGKFAVIIPNSQLNESIRKIVREGF